MNISSQIFVKHAQVLQAMAHPKRLEIINLLRDKELSVSAIQDMLALKQAYLSQHLMVLRKAGVLKTTKKGKEVLYQLKYPQLTQASDAIREILIEQSKTKSEREVVSLDINQLVPLHIDPVCKMRIPTKTAGATYSYQGINYYFCATGCLKKFKLNPEIYASNRNSTS
jgi:YHS domain-containing protein/DNA-binding transcriptional ArsR family regulator